MRWQSLAVACAVGSIAWPGGSSALPAQPAAARVSAADARTAIERVVPLLQSSADTWFEKRTCYSCHHQGVGTIAMAVLRDRGLSVDTARLNAQARRTARPARNWHERTVVHEVSINQPIGQAYRMLGVLAAGHPQTPVVRAVAHMLAGEQHRDGVWRSNSRRPPLEDSEVTATALSLRTLALVTLEGREREFAERVSRARRWLSTVRPVSTEERVMQLLGLAWGGTPAAQLRRYAEALLKEQRPDGGWAQVPTRETDAYATGQALTVLQQAAGIPVTDARVQRGLRYLLSTQDSLGTWRVRTSRTLSPGLPYFETGFPHGKDQFLSYAGTVWAAMALSAVIDARPSAALLGRPAVRFAAGPDTVPDGLTPLHRAALSGSVADVRARLAAGDSVNAASPLGVTPLMAAVHDSAKVHVLLDAGADVNAVTKQGHTPLQLATAYQGAGGSARLLLARGAVQDRALSASNGARVTAFTFALLRGDTAFARVLLAKGADVNGPDPLKESPLMAAVWHADTVMMNWVLDAGALVDDRPRAAGQQIGTPLMIAAEDGVTDGVRVLVRRRARLDLAETGGMTALHYAAGAPDRGTPEILELLLAAGAPLDLVNKKGETPAALARRFGKGWAVERLERGR